MSYRLIVDENLAPATAESLRARGHNATTVAEKFGKDQKDPNIVACARETDTLVLANDTDFLDRDAIGDVKVLFCPRTSLRPGTIAALVDTLAGYVPDQDDLSQITHLREEDLL